MPRKSAPTRSSPTQSRRSSSSSSIRFSKFSNNRSVGPRNNVSAANAPTRHAPIATSRTRPRAHERAPRRPAMCHQPSAILGASQRKNSDGVGTRPGSPGSPPRRGNGPNQCAVSSSHAMKSCGVNASRQVASGVPGARPNSP